MATKPTVTPLSRGFHNAAIMTAKQGARIAANGGRQAESSPSDYRAGTVDQQEFYSTYKQITELQYERELKRINANDDYGI